MKIQLLNYYEKFIIFSILLLPLALIIGPFLTNSIIAIVAIYSLLLFFFKDSIKKFFFNKISILIFIFAIYLIFCSIISDDPKLSLSASLFYSRFLLFSIGIAYILEKNSNFINWFGYSLWFCIGIATIDGYFQFIFGYNIFGWEKFDPIRLSGFFKEELILGSYLSRLLPLCFLLIFFLNKNFLKKIIFVIFCILLIMIDVLIYLTGERTAFLFLFLSTLTILLTIPNFRLIRFVTFVTSLIIILLITINNGAVKERMVNFTLQQTGITSEEHYPNDSGKIYAFSPAHQLHYDSAYLIFLDSPLFGQGPKMFRELCRTEKYDIFFTNPSKSCDVPACACSTHPHHTYMQLLAETGLIGAMSVLVLFLIISYKLFKQFLFVNFFRKEYLDSKLTLVLITFLITLWPLAPSGNFFGSWLNSIYYLPLGFYLFLSKDSRFRL